MSESESSENNQKRGSYHQYSKDEIDEILRLHLEGLSLGGIVKKVPGASKTTVHNIVKAAKLKQAAKNAKPNEEEQEKVEDSNEEPVLLDEATGGSEAAAVVDDDQREVLEPPEPEIEMVLDQMEQGGNAICYAKFKNSDEKAYRWVLKHTVPLHILVKYEEFCQMKRQDLHDWNRAVLDASFEELEISTPKNAAQGAHRRLKR